MLGELYAVAEAEFIFSECELVLCTDGGCERFMVGLDEDGGV